MKSKDNSLRAAFGDFFLKILMHFYAKEAIYLFV